MKYYVDWSTHEECMLVRVWIKRKERSNRECCAEGGGHEMFAQREWRSRIDGMECAAGTGRRRWRRLRGGSRESVVGGRSNCTQPDVHPMSERAWTIVTWKHRVSNRKYHGD